VDESLELTDTGYLRERRMNELSGAFDELTARLSEFFSGLYQWKLALGTSSDRSTVTGKDLDVRGFQVVTGRRISP
jgi:tRNA splicing endonuclease